MIWLLVHMASTILLAIFSGIAAWNVSRTYRATTKGKLYSRLRSSLIWMGISGLVFIVKVTAVVVLAASGWVFAEDKLAMQLPMLAIPAAAIVLFSIPATRAIRAAAVKASKEPPTAQERLAAAAPGWVFPVLISFVASLAAVVQALFIAQWPLQIGTVIAVWSVYVAVVYLLWIRQKSRYHRLVATGSPETGTLAVRVFRKLGVLLTVVLVSAVWFMLGAQSSRLAERMSMADHMHAHMHAHTDGISPQFVSVAELTGPRTGTPDRSFTLEAKKTMIALHSGEIKEAWTYNGQILGPELRVKQGELVEVTLINKDIEDGVTIHWHGVNVQNAEDGVAGMTQDAVMPQEKYVYRFIAEQTGTYWYHSHQQSSKQVQMGLYGVFIVEPDTTLPQKTADMAVVLHNWQAENGTTVSLGELNRLQRKIAEPGTLVRLRFVNAENLTAQIHISGVPFQVEAIDGTDILEPEDLIDSRLDLAAGGRYDVTFVMPDTVVGISRQTGPFAHDGNVLVVSPSNEGMPPDAVKGPIFDPASYGTPAQTMFGPDTRYDRNYTLVFDNRPGFYNGKFNFVHTINGSVFPDAPMFMVREGELVKMTFVNRGFDDHPMHPHGHRMQVLSRNGKAVTGSPWITDTLNVAPGETYEVAFIADNPGIWMDHCHNLEHAAVGMSAHIAYEGVYSPFEMGSATVNLPPE
ncbi:multicopper oxidase domain-containing protein [Paenibacillus sp. KQZ6P-2]|uniref:Multicopper oxidase domain-containing protein n=1 Tax=Paenibacillus mangrovi TaxID=2931978 RepID=A0A9X1WQW3_9BACL|nr:multicopper oxidase domain-containing protein [Paenibacillus mangrovi]MCJ8013662.1 multicopper oxidase domain-containing protein [Paenibacillus mangrovi]